MPVRELLALSTLFYFQMAPEGPSGRRFMDMWDQVRPPVQVRGACLPATWGLTLEPTFHAAHQDHVHAHS